MNDTVLAIIKLLAVIPYLAFILHRIKRTRSRSAKLQQPKPSIWEPNRRSNEWNRLASKERNPGRRAYYNGMASLLSHEDEEIIASMKYFEESIRHPLNDDERRVVSIHLAIAYLNNEEIHKAAQLIEQSDSKSSDTAFARVFLHVMRREMAEARSALLDAGNHPTAQNLSSILELPYGSTEMCTELKQLCHDFSVHLWIYGPTLGSWYWNSKRYGLYVDPNRYSILEERGRSLVAQLEQEPAMFQSASIRFIKNALQTLLERVGSYSRFISITPITNMPEKVMLTDLLPDDLKFEVAEYWRQVSYVFNGIQGVAPLQEQWAYLSNILSGEVERVVGAYRSERYDLLISKKPVPYALVCYMNFTHVGEPFVMSVLVDNANAHQLQKQLQPLIKLIDATSTSQSLEQLLYRKLFDNDSLSEKSLREFAASLPSPLSERINSDIFIQGFMVGE